MWYRKALGHLSHPGKGFRQKIKAASLYLSRPDNTLGLFNRAKRIYKTEGFSGLQSKIYARFLRPYGKSKKNQIELSNIYQEWTKRFDTLTHRDLKNIKKHINSYSHESLPIIAFVKACDFTKLNDLKTSLINQLDPAWVFYIFTDRIIKNSNIAANEPRIKIIAPEHAISSIASLLCKHVLVIDSSIILREHAIYMFSLAATTQTFFSYSDSDIKRAGGIRSNPLFKPSFSPKLLEQWNYFGRCVLLKIHNETTIALLTSLVKNEIDIDSAFRAYTHGLSYRDITHIPFILFHETEPDNALTRYPLVAPNTDIPHKVSIIIPTRDSLNLLKPCLKSIFRKTSYPLNKIQIIIVDNGSKDPQTLKYLEALTLQSNIIVLRDPSKFNYSRVNNQAAKIANGEVLIFLNNDVVIDDASWIDRLVMDAIKPEVGVVGGKLLYPDRTVQHGGILLGIQGVTAHAHHNLAENAAGYLNLNNLSHEVSAVTGACLAIRKSVFFEIGGFNENLAIAFNDVLLCLDALTLGYLNIYQSKPLLIHYESKTRGYDNTEEKRRLFWEEASYTRAQHPHLISNDPFYNPNLSLECAYKYACPPRSIKPWSVFRRSNSDSLRILMLSITHEIGHGVAVVVDLQSRFLAQNGHKVFVGGPEGHNEFKYTGCIRAYVNSPIEAAVFARDNDIDCIVVHTPPFFSILKLFSTEQPILVYDYGEPGPQFFPDYKEREATLAEKKLCLTMTTNLYAISESVRAESNQSNMKVIRIANSHLATWDDSYTSSRETIRNEYGWNDKIVVLNVCRFRWEERFYKGVDIYISLMENLQQVAPQKAASDFVFVLSGKATKKDVLKMRQRGLITFDNVSDEQLISLYAGADVYANFSRWEGYNLGIGQALAMGLPTIGSDIPAHREFGIFTSNDIDQITHELLHIRESRILHDTSSRKPIVWSWEKPLAEFEQAIKESAHRECFRL